MLLNADDYRRAASRALPRFVFDFIEGGAADESCLRRNERDLDDIALLPRILRDTSGLDTHIEVFGKPWRHPFAVTPTGLNGLIRPGADALLAQAAADAGVPFALSTPSNVRLEDIRRVAPGAELWQQLYVMQQRPIAEQIMRRAAAQNFGALVLTVDVPVNGNRERDLRNGFKVPLEPSLRMAWDLATHPRWSVRQLLGGTPNFVNLVEDPNAAPGASAQAQGALLSRSMDRSLVWDNVSWIRDHWRGPLIIKGVLHPVDVHTAIEHGVDGITVSNHGGRQLDAAPSSIRALPGVVAAADGRVPVFVDGGFRRGSDVVKALALGATAVMFGRPLLHAVAVDGREGVRRLLSSIADDLERTMILMGMDRPGVPDRFQAEISASTRATSANSPS